MKESRGLIIFVKNPVKGTVKTRLAKTIGDEKALQVYHHLLQHTRNVASKVDANRFLFYSDQVDTRDNWDEKIFDKHQQVGIDLGERIINAFDIAFDRSDHNIIIGSDCLDLNTEIIEEAYQQLQVYDVVIGPAKDGGYYLLGIKSPLKEIFKSIDWSTSKVLSQTLEIVEGLGLNHKLLKELSDIDTEEDLSKYRL